MNRRIGVFICHCGSNISDVVEVDQVNEEIKKIKDVVLSKTMMFACADSSQKEMIEDIRENQLDAIVVASCSPKLHLYTFRAVAEQAGLNYNQYEQVNIREQDSWAHGDKPGEATEKAIKLIKKGISKVKFAEPLQPIRIQAEKTVLVIGAGISGLRSALELSGMGLSVFLIEEEHYVGGHISEWEKLYMTDESGSQIIGDLYREIIKRDNITLYTGASLIKKSGSIGNFEVTIGISPRYVKPGFNLKDLGKVIEACPIEVKYQEFGLQKTRKAIDYPSGKKYPPLPVIHREDCNLCGECLHYSQEIDLGEEGMEMTLNVGAILLTTGFEHYHPFDGEYGYKTIKNVITLPEFKKLVDKSDQASLNYQEQGIKNIAYIYCVGSRQPEGENRYCSRYCCTAAIHMALQVHKKFPDVNNFHFNRGIRTYGKQEILYHRSCEQGDVFLQFNEDNPLKVEEQDGKTIIRINDLLTEGREMELEADLIVLVTGMIPRQNDKLNEILKVPIGRDRFYNEVHPKLRPVETVLEGIFIAGCSQGPKSISESVKSSLSAASKIFALLGSEFIELDPIQAVIHEPSCVWCEACEQACPFDAIAKKRLNGKYVAEVSKTNCKGCGMCIPVCESNAIQLTGYSDVEVEIMIDALVD
jgi:heterodisulfide reductase subunit A